jgi:hypothetical protein
MHRGSQSHLNKNKMTNVPVTNLVKSRLEEASKKMSTQKHKLRTELRRVMSDRVMKITKCSQQATVEKINQLRIGPPVTTLAASRTVTSVVAHTSNNTNLVLLNKNSSLSADKSIIQQNSQEKKPDSPIETNKLIVLQTIDLVDKQSLVNHLKSVYNDIVDKNGSILLGARQIVSSVTHYVNSNKLDLKTKMDELLNKHLLQTNIKIKQKYKSDEFCDKIKIEVQLQVLLQIELYIVANQSKTKVDDDWVWEIANSIRWLSQNFKEKFKIEKFLFGEIYATYHPLVPDFMMSLMEELGYDKENNDDTDDNVQSSLCSSSAPTSPTGSPLATPVKLSPLKNGLPTITNNNNPFVITKNHLSQVHLKEDSNSNSNSFSNYTCTGGINSLFEDISSSQQFNSNSQSGYSNGMSNHSAIFNDSNENDDNNNVTITNNHCNENTCDDYDLLDQFIKKKPVNRITDYSTTSLRSIAVVQKKRTRLKIRSPYRSPSKIDKRKVEKPKNIPAVKEKNILTDDTTDRKRSRPCLITDTPDHKQNSTIITTRQEKLRKRFSIQQFTPMPVVPDTPIKNETTDTDLSNVPRYSNIYGSGQKSAFSSPIKNIKNRQLFN